MVRLPNEDLNEIEDDGVRIGPFNNINHIYTK